MIRNGPTRRASRVFAVAMSVLGTIALTSVWGTRADGDDKAEKGAFLPTGVRITPNAAPGSIFQALNPGRPSDPTFTVGQAVTTAVSPDGKTLLILTSGYNKQNFTSGENAGKANHAESNDYVFVFDIL